MYTLILLAGGKGTRMKNAVPKQFLLLAGKPIIMHTLERVEKIEEIEEIIITCGEEYISLIEEYRKSYMLNKKIIYAKAGKTRQESVYNGLKKVKTDNVIIHEAARPFVNKSEFKRLIECKEKNVIFTYPIQFTVLKIKDDKVNELLDRNELANIQLPHKFETKTLLEAHEKAREEKREFTEDSSLLYYYTKIDIKTIMGSQYNLKITESLDLIIGEIMYKENLIRKDE